MMPVTTRSKSSPSCARPPRPKVCQTDRLGQVPVPWRWGRHSITSQSISRPSLVNMRVCCCPCGGEKAVEKRGCRRVLLVPLRESSPWLPFDYRIPVGESSLADD